MFSYFVSQTSVGESLQREAVKKKMMKQVRGRIKDLMYKYSHSSVIDLLFFVPF